MAQPRVVGRSRIAISCPWLTLDAETGRMTMGQARGGCLQSAAYPLGMSSNNIGEQSVIGEMAEPGPGARVRLCIPSGLGAGRYPAVVVDRGPGRLVVSVWLWDCYPDYVSLGRSVTVGFPCSQGWGEFESRVTGLYMRSSVVEVMLARPSRVMYKQRRSCLRLPATLPINVSALGNQISTGQIIPGITEDISSKGLRGCLQGQLVCERPVVISFRSDVGLQESRFTSLPVWQEALNDPERIWHRYGFRFLGLPSQSRRCLRGLLTRIKSNVIGDLQADDPLGLLLMDISPSRETGEPYH